MNKSGHTHKYTHTNRHRDTLKTDNEELNNIYKQTSKIFFLPAINFKRMNTFLNEK